MFSPKPNTWRVLACAVSAGAGFFLTTDDGILKRAALIPGIRVTDPIGFIKEVFP